MAVLEWMFMELLFQNGCSWNGCFRMDVYGMTDLEWMFMEWLFRMDVHGIAVLEKLFKN